MGVARDMRALAIKPRHDRKTSAKIDRLHDSIPDKERNKPRRPRRRKRRGRLPSTPLAAAYHNAHPLEHLTVFIRIGGGGDLPIRTDWLRADESDLEFRRATRDQEQRKENSP